MNKSWHIPRRTFLRGMGATIALPALEAMAPSLKALAALESGGEAVFPKRMAFLYLPNGANMVDWTPKETGADFEWPFILEPLKPFQGDLQILTGLAHDKARPHGDGPGDHARASASFLTITSNPTRTSPVKRGKWVLENILGSPPPPPPPNVPELREGKEALTGSLRQRMEQHRADPNCATCHQRMDPIGFGFENFNAIGAWREKDGEYAIDASGQLVSGETFNGPAELKALLVTRKRDEFVQCLARKMLTYALGRGLEYYDKCAVDQICKRLAKDNYKFSTLILEIVKSTPFQMRRGESAPSEMMAQGER